MLVKMMSVNYGEPTERLHICVLATSAFGPYMCTRYLVKREGGEKEKKEERKEGERKEKEGGKF